MNILRNIFGLLITSLLVISCTNPKPSDPGNNGGNTEKPKETITLERANAMYKAYQDRFNAVTKFREGKEDARYGWHSLDFYKNYIAYLEAESKKVNIKISGLRLYYVAYPDDEASQEYKDYQTYIYVPTYLDKKTNRHIAFDPLHIDADGNPLPIHQIITTGKGLTNSSIARVAGGGTASSLANMGEMCKPNCGTQEEMVAEQ